MVARRNFFSAAHGADSEQFKEEDSEEVADACDGGTALAVAVLPDVVRR